MSVFSPKLKRTLWLPVLLGLGIWALWLVVGFAGNVSSFREDRFQDHIYTVWGDTSGLGNPYSVRMVQLSAVEAARASMMLIQNRADVLPFRGLERKKFHLLTLGERLPYFEEYLNCYAKVELSQAPSPSKLPAINWAACQPLIIAINAPEADPATITKVLSRLGKETEVVVVNFCPSDFLSGLSAFSTILQAPGKQSAAQMVAAQVLFGGVAVNRGIPSQLAEELGIEQTFFTEKIRLGYSEGERVGISSDSLIGIDDIVAEGLAAYAFPGCQVLIARKGEVIFHKAYGYHTYRRQRPVRKTDLYDIASITKIAATTLGAMKMYEEGKIDLDDDLNTYFDDPSFTPTRIKAYDTLSVKEYWALLDSLTADSTHSFSISTDTTRFNQEEYLLGRWVRGKGEAREQSPVFDIRLRDLLTHTSGLPATLPIGYYQKKARFFKASQSAGSPYLPNNYLDSLWNETKGLSVDSPRYCYSCVNMLLLQRVIDSLNQQSIAEFLPETFYKPLGLQTLTYNPMNSFPAYRLIPTATDPWREQLIHGEVHDPIAAMMGGVSGNAGLFSNANDLAILAQMWLNGGSYGGESFLQASTLNTFTQRQYGHRGLGFDKPPRHTAYVVGESASLESFGHTGFTGTCLWVDPTEELVYVFLSNRIYPSVSNSRINEYRIRQRIHQLVYDALGKAWRTPPLPEDDQQPERRSFVPDLMFTP